MRDFRPESRGGVIRVSEPSVTGHRRTAKIWASKASSLSRRICELSSFSTVLFKFQFCAPSQAVPCQGGTQALSLAGWQCAASGRGAAAPSDIQLSGTVGPGACQPGLAAKPLGTVVSEPLKSFRRSPQFTGGRETVVGEARRGAAAPAGT
eukprot:130785-Hanusia_phi.AAC.1